MVAFCKITRLRIPLQEIKTRKEFCVKHRVLQKGLVKDDVDGQWVLVVEVRLNIRSHLLGKYSQSNIDTAPAFASAPVGL